MFSFFTSETVEQADIQQQKSDNQKEQTDQQINRTVQIDLFAELKTQQIQEMKGMINKSTKKVYSNSSRDMTTDRKIIMNLCDMELKDNSIQTAQYNLFNFFPKNLLQQYSKLANIYFLLIGVFEMILVISNTEGVPSMYLPLGTINVVSMIKDAVEDRKRHKSDAEENDKVYKCFKDNEFKDVKSSTLRVGNLIKIFENQYVPADILVLQTSDQKGLAYFETKNIDGETNVKIKNINADLRQELKNDQDLRSKTVFFKYEKPNGYLYNFFGQIQFRGENNQLKDVSVDNSNFVLKGSSLKNTEWIVGLVCYEGHSTKIMLTQKKAKMKQSTVEKLMNKYIISVFVVLILICVVASIVSLVWLNVNEKELNAYILSQQDILYSNRVNFVPISLIITLEMVKFLQGQIIQQDQNLISYNDIKPSVQSSGLNEELGQINYIFSDKTGTLTKNQMDFKKFSVKGISYGDTKDNIDLSKFPQVTNVDFADEQLIKIVHDYYHPQNQFVKDFLLHMAICHDIIVQDVKGVKSYNASSPDELALVNFSKFLGVEFLGIDDQNNMEIVSLGQKLNYKLLHTFEFNSDRKRMSVVVQNSQGNIELLCKGADNIILSRLVKEQDQFEALTYQHLKLYSQKGLRTLVMAKKQIQKSTYNQWAQRYQQAELKLINRNEALMELQDELERDMNIVGVSAIEDKLQDEVGYTIDLLKQSGIKIWILTGDKVETAINIAFSCQLLTEDQKQIIMDGSSVNEVQQILKNAELESKNYDNFAIILTGNALHFILEQKEQQDMLMNILNRCQCVIVSRVSPQQKAEVVKLVRKYKPNQVTLAIGDGANDVNMICAAHVGVGIRGVEGQQAARASDYSFGEFKLLKRLLYYHGRFLSLLFVRENYRKNCKLIQYNFYKNVLYTSSQFQFGFYNGFSGHDIYDTWIYQFYNLCYTAMPIIGYSLFDQEFPNTKYLQISYPPNILEQTPQNYKQGMQGKLFNLRNFWENILLGLMQAAIIVHLMLNSQTVDFQQAPGIRNNIEVTSQFIMWTMVWTATQKVLIFCNIYTGFLYTICFLSLLSYAIIYRIFSLMIFADTYNTYDAFWSTRIFWLAFLQIGTLTFIIDYTIQIYESPRQQIRVSDHLQSMIQTESMYHKKDIQVFKKNDLNIANFQMSSKKDQQIELIQSQMNV